MKKYSETHEYVIVDGNIATIGISATAADELGDITYVDLPSEGDEVSKGAVLCSVESVKAASDVYVPVSGKIIEVNAELDGTPEIINDDAEGKGWICKIEMSDTSELDSLKDSE